MGKECRLASLFIGRLGYCMLLGIITFYPPPYDSTIIGIHYYYNIFYYNNTTRGETQVTICARACVRLTVRIPNKMNCRNAYHTITYTYMVTPRQSLHLGCGIQVYSGCVKEQPKRAHIKIQ